MFYTLLGLGIYCCSYYLRVSDNRLKGYFHETFFVLKDELLYIFKIFARLLQLEYFFIIFNYNFRFFYQFFGKRVS